jgi:TRAP transporter TAXI family solute receptor
LRRVLFGLFLGLIALAANHGAQAQTKSAKAWLGVAAGEPAASETVLVADMARLFADDDDFRVLAMLGDSGAGNLAALLENPNVDMAFVAADAFAAAAGKDKGKLELVLRLPPQEVHLLARADIGAIADLSGQEVSFGPAGSASAATAGALFEALGVKVKVLHLDAATAIARLKGGTLAAALVVGGKPSPQVEAIPVAAGIQLLPIPFGAALAAYLPTRLTAVDYPNLIREGGEVATVATGMVLLAIAKDQASRERIDRFVGAFFPRFTALQAQGRHPKWGEVNLAASLSGFKRTRAAEAWLAARPERDAAPVAASASAKASALPAIMSKEEREALFTRFIEWQRDKER